MLILQNGGRHGRHRVVVEFRTACAISGYDQ